MSIRVVIIYFAGGKPLGDLPEDVKAKEIIAKRFETAATAQAPQMGNSIVINNPHINYVAKDQNPSLGGIIQQEIPPSIDIKPIENEDNSNADLIEEKVEKP